MQGHSDPCFVDWDGDGDLDLLSGSSSGGAFLFVNESTKREPKLGRPVTLLEAGGHGVEGTRLGDAHVTTPARATRIWVDDINGDGKLDLLLGDSVTLHYAASGLDEDAVKQKVKDWDARQQKLFASQRGEARDAAAQKRSRPPTRPWRRSARRS